MNISELKTSKYIKKEDCAQPLLVTIDSVRQENVGPEGQKPDYRYVVYFRETEKPLILNTTNGQLIAQITGTEDDDSDEQSDKWIGHQIVLYNEPSVTYHGKRTGGVRVRAPRNRQAPAKSKGIKDELDAEERDNIPGRQKRDWDETPVEETDEIPF